MIKTIKEWLNKYAIVENKLLISYENDLIKRDQTIADRDNIIDDLYEENEELVLKIEDDLKKETWEDYWNNKHPKKNISYLRHETDGDYQIDVRSFFMPNYNYPILRRESDDETALSSLIFIMEKIIYKSDMIVFGYDEYWSYGYQTLKRKQGDCDSGSILLWNIMLHNGIPSWRVRLNAGWVKEPNSIEKVGHAYVTYCRETDNQWVVLDWCYYNNYIPIKNRPLHKDERDYYSIWWSTTKDQSYGNKKYMKSMPEEFIIKT